MPQETFTMTTKEKHSKKLPNGLTEAQLKAMYEYMVLTREYDQRGFKLQRQGRIGFYAGSFGEEACQIGTAMALEERDWIFSSYRQPGVAFYRGVSIQAMMNNLFGNAEDMVEGKQMPVHYTGRKQHFLSISSVIGTQIIQAVGCAMAAKIKNDDAVSITYFGDGGTSSNDFHSGKNICKNQSFFRSFMSKKWPSDNIANGKNIGHRGSELLVNLDKAFFVGFNTHFFQSQILSIGFSSNGHQYFICL